MIRILRRLIMPSNDREKASKNLNNLKQIHRKSNTWFKADLKREIAERIAEYRPRIDMARPLENEIRGERLFSILEEINSLKPNNQALVTSYEVIELWVESLLSDEPIHKARVDELINKMEIKG